MQNMYALSNALLWVAAIVASLVLGAPAFLSLVVLPVLGAVSSAVTWKSRANDAPAA